MTSVFYEYKGSTALWLFDPKLVLAATWDLTDRMDLNVLGGIGPAVNIIETSYYIDKNKFTYLNYELSLGIAYRLGNSPSN